jgi:hypothetical protein
MAGEILAEVVAACGEGALRLFLTGPVREWRLNSFVGDLDRDRKVAFFEIVASAVLEDAHVSAWEEKWLAARRDAVKDEAELVDAALATVKEALPPGSDDAARATFLERRAALFADEDAREKVFKAVLVVQQTGTFSSDPAPLYRTALGITEARASVLLSQLSSLSLS